MTTVLPRPTVKKLPGKGLPLPPVRSCERGGHAALASRMEQPLLTPNQGLSTVCPQQLVQLEALPHVCSRCCLPQQQSDNPMGFGVRLYTSVDLCEASQPSTGRENLPESLPDLIFYGGGNGCTQGQVSVCRGQPGLLCEDVKPSLQPAAVRVSGTAQNSASLEGGHSVLSAITVQSQRHPHRLQLAAGR